MAGPAGYKQCAVVALQPGIGEPGSNPSGMNQRNKKDPSGHFISLMAGPAGFEPANDGTKTRCLTTWRRSNALYILSHKLRLGKTIEKVNNYDIIIL